MSATSSTLSSFFTPVTCADASGCCLVLVFLMIGSFQEEHMFEGKEAQTHCDGDAPSHSCAGGCCSRCVVERERFLKQEEVVFADCGVKNQDGVNLLDKRKERSILRQDRTAHCFQEQVVFATFPSPLFF
jgi:hypothetical protein